MKKLPTILWGILDDKYTKYKFELESGIDKIVRQSLIILSQNVINYLKYFIGHLGFWENLTY